MPLTPRSLPEGGEAKRDQARPRPSSARPQGAAGAQPLPGNGRGVPLCARGPGSHAGPGPAPASACTSPLPPPPHCASVSPPCSRASARDRPALLPPAIIESQGRGRRPPCARAPPKDRPLRAAQANRVGTSGCHKQARKPIAPLPAPPRDT